MDTNIADSACVRRKAYEMLARREHSAEEMLQKLLRKGYPEAIILAVLEELQADNLQSDERFAEAYIFFRYSQGFGPVRIQQELLQRGVSEELILRFLCHEQLDWDLALQKAFDKRFRGIEESDWTARVKQMRFLQYRGFTHEHIRKLFNVIEK